MLLADEFFFLALDDRTGRLLLSPRVLGLGLAGALLSELVLERKVVVTGERMQVVDRQPTADALANRVLDQLIVEQEHPVRSWLVFLAQDAREQVADRLWRGGYIRREQPRRLWRRAEPIYPPTDANTAYWPTARLANKLGRRRPVNWPEAALCGLVAATGLDGHVLYTADSAARGYLNHIVEHLSPSLHALVWHLHAAVGDAVLTGRT